jgi:hypothetical protein
MKIVVFDLDETLGYFTQFGIFWDSLKNYIENKNKKILTQNDFNDILDLYPEYLRPNIINILIYLKKKKQINCCHKMMIYTNNTGPKEWSKHIISYFEEKIKYKLIDQIISAFKINGNIVEISRTTHDKTHEDFIRCTKLPLNAEICFLDDHYYPNMINENIYYINIKPYYYDLSFEEIINRFKKSEIGTKYLDMDFKNDITNQLKMYNYRCIEKKSKEYEIDKILGKYIINHLQEFFNKSNKNKSFKNKSKYFFKRNKTQKNNKMI